MTDTGRQRIVLEGELELGWSDDDMGTPYTQFSNRTGSGPLEAWIVSETDWDRDRCLDGQWVRITIEAIGRPEG